MIKIISFAVITLSLISYAAVGLATGIWPRITDDCPQTVDQYAACSSAVSALEGAPNAQLLDIGEVSQLDGDIEMVRLTGDADPLPNGVVDTHSYSKRQPWNSDESLIVLSQSLYNSETGVRVKENIPVSTERNWSNTIPNVMYGIVYDPEPNNFGRWDVGSDSVEIIRTFDEYEQCSMGQGEGNISNNDRWVLISCRKSGDDRYTLLSFDIEKNEIIGTLYAAEDFNWGSFSQSGKWILVENSKIGNPVYRLIRYRPDFTQETVISDTNVEHGDLGLDYAVRDVYVMINQSNLYFIDLDTGATTLLQVGGGSENLGFGHVSCRNIQRIGWCYVSTHGSGSIGAFRVGINSLNIAATIAKFFGRGNVGLGAYENWGFHNSTASDYQSQPKAAVSPSGRQIVFTSDWQGSTVASDFILRNIER